MEVELYIIGPSDTAHILNEKTGRSICGKCKEWKIYTGSLENTTLCKECFEGRNWEKWWETYELPVADILHSARGGRAKQNKQEEEGARIKGAFPGMAYNRGVIVRVPPIDIDNNTE